ncbi:MAG: haloalkane dehalogenase [Pseudomonadota bacterium]
MTLSDDQPHHPLVGSVARTPDARFDALPDWPFAPNYVDTLTGYEGLRLHYVDAGPEDAAVTFLCLHGQPTWSYLYRKMIPIFADAGHRVIAPDLFGFGRSDKPEDDAVYTYYFHRKALLAFVEAMDLTNVCLVVQDWGGLLGLTLPMERPSRYSRLLVMNTFLPVGEDAGPGFLAWRAFNKANPDLDIAMLMKRGTPSLSDAEADAYGAPFPEERYKAGVRRFPELVMVKGGSTEGIDTSFSAREFWSERWDGESFMAIGQQDPVITEDSMRSLHSLIRNCPEPLLLEDAGHFVQEWGERVANAGLDHFKLG